MCIRDSAGGGDRRARGRDRRAGGRDRRAGGDRRARGGDRGARGGRRRRRRRRPRDVDRALREAHREARGRPRLPLAAEGAQGAARGHRAQAQEVQEEEAQGEEAAQGAPRRGGRPAAPPRAPPEGRRGQVVPRRRRARRQQRDHARRRRAARARRGGAVRGEREDGGAGRRHVPRLRGRAGWHALLRRRVRARVHNVGPPDTLGPDARGRADVRRSVRARARQGRRPWLHARPRVARVRVSCGGPARASQPRGDRVHGRQPGDAPQQHDQHEQPVEPPREPQRGGGRTMPARSADHVCGGVDLARDGSWYCTGPCVSSACRVRSASSN